MTSNERTPAELTALAAEVRHTLTERLPGLGEAVDRLLVAYLAGGHALLQGVPGIGKTLLARSFAHAMGGRFARVQFTPDLMPADVVGANVFDPQAGGFRLVRGPVFADILMADEINRTPPKTQAALLEAMQEGQVTIDGVPHALPDGFFVIATQNPIEFEGTYPLPEAQLDRFLLRIEMGLPARPAELELYRRAMVGELAGWGEAQVALEPVLDAQGTAALHWASTSIHVADELLDYLLRLAEAVRESPHVELGPSPRAGLALLEAARANALLAGRDFVLPEDVKTLLAPCWGHRLLLVAESELEGQTPASVLGGIAAAVEVPQ